MSKGHWAFNVWRCFETQTTHCNSQKKKCQELTIVDIVTLYEQIPYCDVTFLFLSLMKNRMLSYIYLTLILLL